MEIRPVVVEKIVNHIDLLKQNQHFYGMQL